MTAPGFRRLGGCVPSFAYRNPGLRVRSALPNPQTGRYETVRIEPLPSGVLEARGQSGATLADRISGAAEPFVVEYSPDGARLALDAKVAGGRTPGDRPEDPR